MSEQIEFFDRADEIALVEKLIAERDTRRIVCVSGERGIGKTLFLEHLTRLYQQPNHQRNDLLVPKRLDFYDPELHVKETLASTIASNLGDTHFASYIEALVIKRRMEVDQYPASRLREEDERADRAFTQCLNSVTVNHRVVLCADTIEHIYGSPAWEFFQELAGNISNAVIILSGRNALDVWQGLVSQLGEEDVKLVELAPFEQSNAQIYLRQKQTTGHIPLSERLEEKILALAAGKPMLIDLAMDWLARQVPMPWLLEKSPDELRNLSHTQREELEKAMISPIAELREPRDHLLWIMALIRPLGREMAARLTRWSSTVFDEVWQDASTLSFVRVIPGDQLMIHDVVRDMMLSQLQFEIEPERKSVWISDALKYLAESSQKKQVELEGIHTAGQIARESQNDKEFWDLLVKEEKAERALWTIEGQLLAYRILQQPEAGLEALEKEYYEATQRKDLQKRGVLLAEVQEARDRLHLSRLQVYKIDLLRAVHLFEIGIYDQSESLGKELLSQFGDTPEREVELRILLGNVVIRKGNFSEGLAHFERATKISRQQHLQNWLVRTQNAYGWSCRLMGRLEEASSHYREALKLALQNADQERQTVEQRRMNEEQQALILNNLGYVYALQRNRDSAIRLCQQALDLFQRNSDEAGRGRVFSTLGDIWTEFNEPNEALMYYKKALIVFESSSLQEMQSTVYCNRGRAFWLMGDLASAQRDLEDAQKIGLKKDRPIYFHYLAEVNLSKKDLAKARELFEESYNESLSAPDPFYELNSLGDLAKIAMIEGELDARAEYSRRLDRFRDVHSGIRYHLPEGLLLRYLGDMYLLAEETKQALGFYEQALPQIAQAGSYEPYTISGQLHEMETIVLTRVKPSVVVALGGELEQFWLERQYDERWPEVLRILATWKSWRPQKKDARSETYEQ